jgi:DNA polymerase
LTQRISKAPPRATRTATPAFEGIQIPKDANLADLRELAHTCRACPLFRNATQTVFGEGSAKARWVLVGEQPGDQEDLTGRPFVGPAGKMLDRALAEAGIDRGQCYVTNAVKHFKWEPRGKRRLHKKPSAREIAACRPWLLAELELIAPQFLICLGATAARAVFDRIMKITDARGKLLTTPGAQHTIVTVHPSALLRAPDPQSREEAYRRFVRDLTLVSGNPEPPANRRKITGQ